MRLLAFPFLVFPLVACAPDPGAAPNPTSLGAPTDEAAPASLCEGVVPTRAPIAKEVVRETVDIWGDRTCPDYLDDCQDDYLAFMFASEAHARFDDDVENTVMQMWDMPLLPGPLTGDAFAAAAVDALNLCPMLDGLDERPLATRVIRDEADGLHGDLTGLTWYVLEFTDELIGTFSGVLLVPDEPDGSAVLGVHGHGTEGRDWPDAYHALEYVRDGRIFLGINVRVSASDEREDEIAHQLLRAGFSLQGLHIYEMLVAQKYLRWLPEVDPSRIALMGHSAGSMKGSVAIRITDGFMGYVSDNPVSFSPPDPEFGLPPFNEDLLPGLQPYTDLFNDFSTASTPVLTQPYGFPDGPAAVQEFLAGVLDPT